MQFLSKEHFLRRCGNRTREIGLTLEAPLFSLLNPSILSVRDTYYSRYILTAEVVVYGFRNAFGGFYSPRRFFYLDAKLMQKCSKTINESVNWDFGLWITGAIGFLCSICKFFSRSEKRGNRMRSKFSKGVLDPGTRAYCDSYKFSRTLEIWVGGRTGQTDRKRVSGQAKSWFNYV